MAFSLGANIVNAAVSVSTDKSTYTIGESVTITVSGAAASSLIQFQVTNPSGNPVDFWETTASPLGNCSFSWDISDSLSAGQYRILIKDQGTGQLAITTFLIARAESWSFSLTSSIGGFESESTLGVMDNATLGFDTDAGDLLLPPGFTGVEAYFWYPDNPTSPVDFRKLSTSYHPFEYPCNWTIKVHTFSGTSGNLTLSWISTEIESIPSNYFATLDTPSGGVDMRSGDSYGWVADADTTYTFMISITSEVEFTLELNIGWNMVSIPVVPDDHSASSVLSDVGFFQLVTWSGTGYVPATSFEAGKGYWLLVLEDVNVTVSGSPVYSLSLSLSTGWSMIGGTYDEVQAADVFPGFYQLVTWTGTGYIPATVFEPGRGYWALVLAETPIQLPPT